MLEDALKRILAPRLADASDAMADAVRQNIQRSEGAGTALEPLRWPRASDGSMGRPLFHTGKKLLSSIKHDSDEDRARVTTNFVGARVHQFGRVIRPVKAKRLRFAAYSGVKGRPTFVEADSVEIPARPYMTLSSEQVQNVSKSIAGD